MRKVVIESATCLCARWTAPRDVIFGNGRHLALNEVFFDSGITAILESLGHQEAVGRDAQSGVMVKAAPTPSFIVAKPEVLLQILVIALNAPTHLGDKHHLLQRGLLWRCAEEV